MCHTLFQHLKNLLSVSDNKGGGKNTVYTFLTSLLSFFCPPLIPPNDCFEPSNITEITERTTYKDVLVLYILRELTVCTRNQAVRQVHMKTWAETRRVQKIHMEAPDYRK